MRPNKSLKSQEVCRMKKAFSVFVVILMMCLFVPNVLASDLEETQLKVIVSDAYSDIIKITNFKSYYSNDMANFDVTFKNNGEKVIDSVDFLFILFDENMTYINSFNASSDIDLESGMQVNDNFVNLELKGMDVVMLLVNGVTYSDGSSVQRNLDGYKNTIMHTYNPSFSISGTESKTTDAFMAKGGRLVVDFAIEKATKYPVFMVEVKNAETNEIEGITVWFDNSPLAKSKTMVLDRGGMYYLNIISLNCNYKVTVTHYI